MRNGRMGLPLPVREPSVEARVDSATNSSQPLRSIREPVSLAFGVNTSAAHSQAWDNKHYIDDDNHDA
jgi:hypothetical protein